MILIYIYVCPLGKIYQVNQKNFNLSSLGKSVCFAHTMSSFKGNIRLKYYDVRQVVLVGKNMKELTEMVAGL